MVQALENLLSENFLSRYSSDFFCKAKHFTQ